MEKTKKTGLGTAGLVLGIIAICMSFIPIINFLSFIMGGLAFIFGIIALIKGDSKGKTIATIIIAILTFVVATNANKIMVDTIDEAVSTLGEDLNSSLSSNDQNTNNSQEIMEVDYNVLHQDYMDNPISADAKYKGKILKLTGNVENIDREINQNTYITFNVGGQYSFKDVRITFKKSEESKVAQLKKGQKVTVKGKCTGTLLSTTVALTDSEIVE